MSRPAMFAGIAGIIAVACAAHAGKPSPDRAHERAAARAVASHFGEADDVLLSRAAYLVALNTYHFDLAHRVESALCVTAWDTSGGFVLVYGFTPAVETYADSVNVHFAPCDGPWAHSHIVDNGWRYTPTPIDSQTA